MFGHGNNYQQKIMKFDKGFPYEYDFENDEVGLVKPEKGLQLDNPNTRAPEPSQPEGHIGGSFAENMERIRARRAENEPDKEEAVTKVELYDRGKQLNQSLNDVAQTMMDRGLPVLQDDVTKKTTEESRFAGGSIDMRKYVGTPGIGQKVVEGDMVKVKSFLRNEREETKRNTKINALDGVFANALDYQEKVR